MYILVETAREKELFTYKKIHILVLQCNLVTMTLQIFLPSPAYLLTNKEKEQQREREN